MSINIFAAPVILHNMSLTDKWCVYEIWHGAPSALEYIGTCKISAIGTVPDARRNAGFNARVTGSFTLRIIATGDRVDCHNYRARLVRMSAEPPPCNRLNALVRYSAIKCVNDGRIYRTQSEACAAYGITQGNMSNHLRGAPSYNTLKGLKFMRVAVDTIA